MTISTVNVYSFSMHLKSQQRVGDHTGNKVIAIGKDGEEAQAVIQEQFGDDLAMLWGGVLLNGLPAFTNREESSEEEPET
jgi:hypothetical protein